MTSRIIAFAAALATGSAVHAADLPMRAPPAGLQSVPIFTWAGPYIGLNAGYAEGRYSFDLTSPRQPLTPGQSTALRASDDGLIGGAQVGYNWQLGTFVVGLEGDVQRVRQRASAPVTSNGAFFGVGDRFEARSDWAASLRGRAGVAIDRVLIYATGGAAFSQLRFGARYSTGVGNTLLASTSDEQSLVGWTLGGGIEAAVTNAVSLGVEYRYTDFGRERYDASFVAFGQPFRVGGHADLRTHAVMGRLNFRFAGF